MPDKTTTTIPGLVKWDRYAGGTAALQGTSSYGLTTDIGNYTIHPPERRGGGYIVLFENVLGKLTGGLHQPLGPTGELEFLPMRRARSPQEGAKWAREHYRHSQARLAHPTSNPPVVGLGQALVALGLGAIGVATVVAGVRLGGGRA